MPYIYASPHQVMNTRILILCIMLLCAIRTTAQPVLPADIIIDERLDYNRYKQYVIPCIDWLQQTPLTGDRAQRKRIDNFIMAWLQKNTEVVVTMPEYLVKFQNVSNEMYFLYTGGWIKYALQTKDSNRKNYYLAGVRSMLDYYAGNNGVKKNDYMDVLVAIDKEGKLEKLLDSTNYAENTVLYMKPPSDKNEFDADENFFQFHYTAINFIDPKALGVRYKLEGHYDDWLPTHNESIIFPKLPPGDYNFRIQASMFPDFSHAIEKSYAFTIKAPFWKQPLFILLVVVGVVFLVYLYTRQREQNLKKVAMLQQERMIYEYDHLRNQINPHFLFNSLNTLTGMIEEEPKRAVEYSEHLSDLYRNILAYHSEDLVYLTEELEILNSYIHIQQSRFGEALKVVLDIPDEISQNRKIVPLALQLLVENAMKHNIVSKAHPLIISIKATKDSIVVSNNIQPKLSKEKGTGMGLQNIRKRYALATDKPIYYGAGNGEYTVKLPLL